MGKSTALFSAARASTSDPSTAAALLAQTQPLPFWAQSQKCTEGEKCLRKMGCPPLAPSGLTRAQPLPSCLKLTFQLGCDAIAHVPELPAGARCIQLETFCAAPDAARSPLVTF